MDNFNILRVVNSTREIFEIVNNSYNSGTAIQIDEKNEIHELCKKISDETYKMAEYIISADALIGNILNKTKEILNQLSIENEAQNESE